MHIELKFSIDTAIALVALLLSIGSMLYTWYSNLFSIELFHEDLELVHEHNLISFTIANTSSKPLKILDIQLFHKEQEIIDNGFDPEEYEQQINEEKARQWDAEHPPQYFAGVPINSLHQNPYRFNLAVKVAGATDTSNNFEKDVFLLPSEEVRFSYYVDVLPDEIVVKSDKKIFRASKKQKSFSVTFN